MLLAVPATWQNRRNPNPTTFHDTRSSNRTRLSVSLRAPPTTTQSGLLSQKHYPPDQSFPHTVSSPPTSYSSAPSATDTASSIQSSFSSMCAKVLFSAAVAADGLSATSYMFSQGRGGYEIGRTAAAVDLSLLSVLHHPSKGAAEKFPFSTSSTGASSSSPYPCVSSNPPHSSTSDQCSTAAYIAPMSDVTGCVEQLFTSLTPPHKSAWSSRATVATMLTTRTRAGWSPLGLALMLATIKTDGSQHAKAKRRWGAFQEVRPDNFPVPKGHRADEFSPHQTPRKQNIPNAPGNVRGRIGRADSPTAAATETAMIGAAAGPSAVGSWDGISPDIRGRREVAALLLRLAVLDQEGGTLLHIAYDFLAWLPKLDDNLADQLIQELILLYSNFGLYLVLRILLHAALLAACRLGRRRLVASLIRSQAVDVECQFFSPVACRPLHLAAASGHGAIAQMLVDAGAGASTCDEFGLRPMEKLALAHRTVNRSRHTGDSQTAVLPPTDGNAEAAQKRNPTQHHYNEDLDDASSSGSEKRENGKPIRNHVVVAHPRKNGAKTTGHAPLTPLNRPNFDQLKSNSENQSHQGEEDGQEKRKHHYDDWPRLGKGQ
eukprot:GHVT01048243.1.p1 GENE.GHVT01048243.1~~GHVT01048243.1.p1  ORF type:complete len:602 (+),score=76.87 GHVT01048243.1:3656-5461(+)